MPDRLPARIRASTGAVQDRIIAIAGLAHWPNGLVEAFTQLTDEARSYPVALHKAAVQMMDQAKTLGIREIYATPAPEQPAAERWMKRLGFQETELNGAKVFQWRRSEQ